MVPPLRGRRAADGAQEKAGHSGRDDGNRNGKPRSGLPPFLRQGERKAAVTKTGEKHSQE